MTMLWCWRGEGESVLQCAPCVEIALKIGWPNGEGVGEGKGSFTSDSARVFLMEFGEEQEVLLVLFRGLRLH